MTKMAIRWFGVAVALLGAFAHVYFAFLEAVRWNTETVRKIAPGWFDDVRDPRIADAHVAWARRLAFNVGAYNLVLALGLTWTACAFYTGARGAHAFGLFFALWLLAAAAAALYTQVVKAFAIQGALGLLLLVAAVWR